NQLGMTLVFNPSAADLSGINGHQAPNAMALFISRIFHKALTEVNEKGTEAAAATAIVAPPAASLYQPPQVPIFRADHPFLFAIRDRKTGTILFLGRIADPSGTSVEIERPAHNERRMRFTDYSEPSINMFVSYSHFPGDSKLVFKLVDYLNE